jgi:glycosyltransferase involved in cell wall biosynthesis
MPHISVVIPVYKAEDCLYVLYKRLADSLETITQDFELILVEDCGGDRSWDIIIGLANSDSRVKGIQFSRNFGQHYGITAGLDHCDGDWVVVMDCDLQDRPEEIPRLYDKAQEGYDVVLATRGKRKDSPLKRVTSWLFYQIFNYFTELQYDGEVGNFRIISRQMVQSFCLMRERLRFFGGLVDWMGFSTWGIENQSHWILDCTFAEDSCRIRSWNSPRNFALLRRIALNREQTYKRSLRQKMKRTSIDNNYMIQVLSCCFLDSTLDSSQPFCQA